MKYYPLLPNELLTLVERVIIELEKNAQAKGFFFLKRVALDKMKN